MAQCKEEVWKGFHTYTCARKAVKDGYCTQHHPDSVKARAQAAEERYKKKRENSPSAKLERAVNEITQLKKEIQHLKIALADAIRRPMGVIPDSAEGLVSQEELDLAEARRTTTTEKRA